MIGLLYIFALRVKFLYLLQKSDEHELDKGSRIKNNMYMVHDMPSHYLCIILIINI